MKKLLVITIIALAGPVLPFLPSHGGEWTYIPLGVWVYQVIAGVGSGVSDPIATGFVSIHLLVYMAAAWLMLTLARKVAKGRFE